jgi:hypothetical protein
VCCCCAARGGEKFALLKRHRRSVFSWCLLYGVFLFGVSLFWNGQVCMEGA